MIGADEAKSMWCPMARVNFHGGPAAVNRKGHEELVTCIADACMAWRWQQERDGVKRLGYCGAFGRPEVA